MACTFAPCIGGETALLSNRPDLKALYLYWNSVVMLIFLFGFRISSSLRLLMDLQF